MLRRSDRKRKSLGYSAKDRRQKLASKFQCEKKHILESLQAETKEAWEEVVLYYGFSGREEDDGTVSYRWESTSVPSESFAIGNIFLVDTVRFLAHLHDPKTKLGNLKKSHDEKLETLYPGLADSFILQVHKDFVTFALFHSDLCEQLVADITNSAGVEWQNNYHPIVLPDFKACDTLTTFIEEYNRHVKSNNAYYGKSFHHFYSVLVVSLGVSLFQKVEGLKTIKSSGATACDTGTLENITLASFSASSSDISLLFM